MSHINYNKLFKTLVGQRVERPNKASSGTLSGHAAGEPFEKKVYENLKQSYKGHIFKQYEYLNDLYLRNPKHLTVAQKNALIASPTVLFLLSRGEKATKDWDPTSIFAEKQNDTADIVYYKDGFFELIDVKTRNLSKSAQAPNIISAYKVAQMCALMIDNKDYSAFELNYIEVDWLEDTDNGALKCVNAHRANLFKAPPSTLYINWAAAMQIQFHVSDVSQSWHGSTKEWVIAYLKCFVRSAKERCDKMIEKYVTPFEKYIN